jgi:hypothetical protein
MVICTLFVLKGKMKVTPGGEYKGEELIPGHSCLRLLAGLAMAAFRV